MHSHGLVNRDNLLFCSLTSISCETTKAWKTKKVLKLFLLHNCRGTRLSNSYEIYYTCKWYQARKSYHFNICVSLSPVVGWLVGWLVCKTMRKTIRKTIRKQPLRTYCRNNICSKTRHQSGISRLFSYSYYLSSLCFAGF